jgi:hypothetical protein
MTLLPLNGFLALSFPFSLNLAVQLQTLLYFLRCLCLTCRLCSNQEINRSDDSDQWLEQAPSPVCF